MNDEQPNKKEARLGRAVTSCATPSYTCICNARGTCTLEKANANSGSRNSYQHDRKAAGIWRSRCGAEPARKEGNTSARETDAFGTNAGTKVSKTAPPTAAATTAGIRRAAMSKRSPNSIREVLRKVLKKLEPLTTKAPP
jgi:hypothetical protein